MNKKTIKLLQNEFLPLVNILNEVCHGLYVQNFENTIGAQQKTVVALMDKILDEKREKEITLALDHYELNFLQKSFEEVFRQIEEWEFQTRIGITIEEANAIKNKLT